MKDNPPSSSTVLWCCSCVRKAHTMNCSSRRLLPFLFRTSPGSLAMLAAMRRASSRVRNFVAPASRVTATRCDHRFRLGQQLARPGSWRGQAGNFSKFRTSASPGPSRAGISERWGGREPILLRGSVAVSTPLNYDVLSIH